MNNLYNTIKALRNKEGWSQEEMSNKLNVQQATYCNWEKGKVDITIERLVQISKIFNLPVTYFFDKNIQDLINTLNEKVREADETLKDLLDVNRQNIVELSLPKIPKEPIEHYIEKIEHQEKIIEVQTSDLGGKNKLVEYQEKKLEKYESLMKIIIEYIEKNKKLKPSIIKQIKELID
jgi:transcriptional regulator with XRE-family HTH domain